MVTTKTYNKISTKMGRPSVIDKKVVKKLIVAFRVGCNITEACDYAGISRQVFYYNYKSDEDFYYKINKARVHLVLTARTVIYNAIVEGNLEIAKWYLDKKYKVDDLVEEELERREIKSTNGISYQQALKILLSA